MEKYYLDLLVSNTILGSNTENGHVELDSNKKESSLDSVPVPEKWKGQIEKDFRYATFGFLISCFFFVMSY